MCIRDRARRTAELVGRRTEVLAQHAHELEGERVGHVRANLEGRGVAGALDIERVVRRPREVRHNPVSYTHLTLPTSDLV